LSPDFEIKKIVDFDKMKKALLISAVLALTATVWYEGGVTSFEIEEADGETRLSVSYSFD
jgi:hypothetical protein